MQVASEVLGATLQVLPINLRTGLAAMYRIESLIARLPDGWADAARVGLANPAAEGEAWTRIVRSLGWRIPEADPIPLCRLTVRVATFLQLGPAFDELRVKQTQYIREARANYAPLWDPHTDWIELGSTLRRLWSLRWENEHKEAFWRLTQDGFPGFSMHRAQRRGPNVALCPCGVPMSDGDRCHHFWDCAVARELRYELEACLGATVLRAQIWLLELPPDTHQAVWDVVGLAAITALEHGRRALYRCRGEMQDRAAAVAHAIVLTKAEFWARLTNYATLGIPPRNWREVPVGHPFLAPAGDNTDSIVVRGLVNPA